MISVVTQHILNSLRMSTAVEIDCSNVTKNVLRLTEGRLFLACLNNPLGSYLLHGSYICLLHGLYMWVIYILVAWVIYVVLYLNAIMHVFCLNASTKKIFIILKRSLMNFQ